MQATTLATQPSLYNPTTTPETTHSETTSDVIVPAEENPERAAAEESRSGPAAISAPGEKTAPTEPTEHPQQDQASECNTAASTSNLTSSEPDCEAQEHAPLPPFNSIQPPKFVWGTIDGESLARSISCCYSETVHWKKNLFKIPSGKSGISFVKEMTRLFQAYADSSTLESIAIKAAMVMPVLPLQKPHPNSKAKDQKRQLERRLKTWVEGDIDQLIIEGRTIQKQLNTSANRKRPQKNLAQSFSRLMFQGKVRAALRLITNQPSGGVLPLDKPIPSNGGHSVTVREMLHNKHPPGQNLVPSAIVEPDPDTQDPHPILFEKIDGDLIKRVALKMDGSSGPSGMDAAGWKRLCTAFGSHSADLCTSLACTAKRLCTEYVDPKGIDALVACRLIALDKCSGVRPIGVGETARRIINKAISYVIKDYIQEAAGALQLCAGHESGCEAAIHSMREVFASTDTEAIILVDASNAFNALNSGPEKCEAPMSTTCHCHHQHIQI